jgi:hypothetical protein
VYPPGGDGTQNQVQLTASAGGLFSANQSLAHFPAMWQHPAHSGNVRLVACACKKFVDHEMAPRCDGLRRLTSAHRS